MEKGTAKTKFVPKVKKRLTMPILKMKIDLPVYVKITGKMFVGKKLEDKKEPAILCPVVDLETGAECQIILSAVVKGILSDEYANDSYIGKGFSLTKHAKPSGKAYNAYSISELEL